MQYEQRPQSGVHVPELVSAGLLGSLASADRPPSVTPLVVGNPLRGVADAITGVLPTAMAIKTQKLQMPVTEAKAENEMKEQLIGEQRLKSLMPGGSSADMAPFSTTIRGSDISITPTQVPFGANPPVNYDPSIGQSDGSEGDTSTDDEGAQNLRFNPTAKPQASASPASSESSSPTTSATSAASQPNISQAKSIQPLDSPVVTRTHATPAEALAWAKENIGTHAISARQEFDPRTGLATRRNIVTFKGGKDQPDVEQPVHSDYMFANMGNWKPEDSTQPAEINPAIAGVPTPAEKLEQGVLTPADVVAQGGPLWAGAKNAPQDPLAGATPYQYAPRLGPPGTTFLPPPTAKAVVRPTAATPAQVINHPSVVAENNDDMWQKEVGVTGNDLMKIASNPKNISIIGPAETQPAGTMKDQNGNDVPIPPSQKVNVNIYGKQRPAYIDPFGNPYIPIWKTPYSETRVLANGHTVQVDNQISLAEDKAMMQDSMKAGTVSGNWQSLTRAQKIAAYQAAQALSTNPVDKDETNKSTAMANVLDAGNLFLKQIQDNATPSDPTAVGKRNLYHQAVHTDIPNAVAPAINEFVKDITGKDIGLKGGDPQAVELRNSYNRLLEAMHSEHTARPLPPGEHLAQQDVGEIGNYWDPNLPDQVRSYLQTAKFNLRKQINTMVGMHNRLDLNAVAASHRGIVGTADNGTPGAPGTTADNPFRIGTSMEKYNQIPDGYYYLPDGYDHAIKKDTAKAEALKKMQQQSGQ